MPMEHDGSHSITFIDTSGSSNVVRRSWIDWHLIPTSRPLVVPEQPNISIVQVPGSNRFIDVTDIISGVTMFGRRTGSWEFYVDHDRWSSWTDCFNTVKEFINGKRLSCVLEDEHNKVYTGRFSLNGWKSDSENSSIVINYDLDPVTTSNSFVYTMANPVVNANAFYNFAFETPLGISYINTGFSNEELRRRFIVQLTYSNGEIISDYPNIVNWNKSLVNWNTKNANVTYTITYYTPDGNVKKTVSVTTYPKELQNIEVTSRPSTLTLGQSVYTLKNYLSVKANHVNDNGQTTQFTLSSSDYSIDGDVSSVGEKEITVGYAWCTDKFNITVVQ